MWLLRHRSQVFSFLAGAVFTSALFMIVLGGLSPIRPRSPVVGGASDQRSIVRQVASTSRSEKTVSPSIAGASTRLQQTPVVALNVHPRVATELSDPRLRSNAEFIAKLRQERPQTMPGTTILFMYLGVPSYIETALYQCRIWNLYSRIVLVTDQVKLSSAEFVRGK